LLLLLPQGFDKAPQECNSAAIGEFPTLKAAKADSGDFSMHRSSLLALALVVFGSAAPLAQAILGFGSVELPWWSITSGLRCNCLQESLS
jgi:hypothetical protein